MVADLERNSRTRRGIGVVLLATVSGLLVSAAPAYAADQAASRVARAATTLQESAVTATVRPVLRLGSRGSAVTMLQQRLTTLHYDVGPIDGDFGSQTYHGVVAFQKVNNLTRDGIVGPITWAALDRPLIPRPKHWHSAYSVEVNLTKQVVYLARQGAVMRILDASSGKASTPTPTGSFGVYRRIDGWRESSLGLLWRPNYFYRGYAVHGSTSVPTYPASHGCVRVTIQAMNRLWSILRIGTPVHIYR
ncbi:MAG TPA: L,D-transpeptidase family protein [Micromonosporaceae bacterium]|jgi:N-acetylmuramoyl-L-alanine amidase